MTMAVRRAGERWCGPLGAHTALATVPRGTRQGAWAMLAAVVVPRTLKAESPASTEREASALPFPCRESAPERMLISTPSRNSQSHGPRSP